MTKNGKRKSKAEIAAEYVEETIRQSQRTLDEFRMRYEAHPLGAFEFAGGKTVEAAARLEVALQIKVILTHPRGGVEKALTMGHERVLRGARWPMHSSGTVNLVEQSRTQAWAEFVSHVEEY